MCCYIPSSCCLEELHRFEYSFPSVSFVSLLCLPLLFIFIFHLTPLFPSLPLTPLFPSLPLTPLFPSLPLTPLFPSLPLTPLFPSLLLLSSPPSLLLFSSPPPLTPLFPSLPPSYSSLPHRYDSLLHVPAYANYVRERFERCLDLYMCPRQRKMRVR